MPSFYQSSGGKSQFSYNFYKQFQQRFFGYDRPEILGHYIATCHELERRGLLAEGEKETIPLIELVEQASQKSLEQHYPALPMRLKEASDLLFHISGANNAKNEKEDQAAKSHYSKFVRLPLTLDTLHKLRALSEHIDAHATDASNLLTVPGFLNYDMVCQHLCDDSQDAFRRFLASTVRAFGFDNISTRYDDSFLFGDDDFDDLDIPQGNSFTEAAQQPQSRVLNPDTLAHVVRPNSDIVNKLWAHTTVRAARHAAAVSCMSSRQRQDNRALVAAHVDLASRYEQRAGQLDEVRQNPRKTASFAEASRDHRISKHPYQTVDQFADWVNGRGSPALFAGGDPKPEAGTQLQPKQAVQDGEATDPRSVVGYRR